MAKQYTVGSPAGQMYPAKLVAKNKDSYRVTYNLPDGAQHTVTFHDKFTADGRFTSGRFTNEGLTLFVDGVSCFEAVKAKFARISEHRTQAKLERERWRASLYSISELKGRGWSDTAIDNFLPAKGDFECDNPYYSKAGAPMRFWLVSRVSEIEESDGFREWAKGATKRSEAAQKAVATKIEKMIAVVEKAEITIKTGWTEDAIMELAIRTHGGNYAGDPGEFHWSNRTAINCIRHNLTNYEQLWKLINRGETAQAAYQILRERVDEVIEEAYPQYFVITESAT